MITTRRDGPDKGELPDPRKPAKGFLEVCIPLLILAVTSFFGLSSGLVSQQDGSDSLLARMAAEEIQKPAVNNLSGQDRSWLLRVNFHRFFATYAAHHPNSEERARLVQTLIRMSTPFAQALYSRAALQVAGSGDRAVTAEAIELIVSELLPREEAAYDSVVFFPEAAPESRVPVEIWDLEAMTDSGFSWLVILNLAESLSEQELDQVSLDEAAIRALAYGVDTYSLLVLRIAGGSAREELAPKLHTRHLRSAGKEIVRRSGEKGLRHLSSEPETQDARAFLIDVTESSGFHFRHESSAWLSRFRRAGILAPSFSGGGIASADLDRDGWPDLIVCGGKGCSVFMNSGDGSFDDTTERSGLSVDGEARMPLLADFDNDGLVDVFVTYARDTNRIFRNSGKGAFKDVTLASGLEVEGDISGPAVAMDYDDDGLLDIYVGNFGGYLQGATPWASPDAQNAQPNRLYRNLGGLKFSDVTEQAGVGNTGWAQAMSHLDFDRDGDQDLYVANDFGRNELYVNQGDGTFLPMGSLTGSDNPFHGMNVAFADLNHDDRPDIYISNIWDVNPATGDVIESNSLLVSQQGADGSLSYVDRAGEAGMVEFDTGWSWGGLFFDADEDGDDDLLVVNGLNDYNTFLTWRPHPTLPGEQLPNFYRGQANSYYRNDGGLAFGREQISGAEMDGLNSRSLTLLDYDHDGDLDVAISAFHAEARLFRNDLPQPDRHWIQVELVGDPSRGTNRDAIGAELVVRGPGGLRVWRMVSGGTGYLASVDRVMHVGLGDVATCDLEIRWPGGEVQTLEAVAADRGIRVRQGEEGFETVLEAPPRKSPG